MISARGHSLVTYRVAGDPSWGETWHAHARTLDSNTALLDDDAGNDGDPGSGDAASTQSRDAGATATADAGARSMLDGAAPSNHEPTPHDAGARGSAGAGSAQGGDAGATQRGHDSTRPGDASTVGSAATDASVPTNDVGRRARNGCQCDIADANREPPVLPIVLMLFAATRVIARRLKPRASHSV
jgi:hypothetical protein